MKNCWVIISDFKNDQFHDPEPAALREEVRNRPNKEEKNDEPE